MNKTTVRVSDYYGHPEYYPFMARDMFAALESAFLNDAVSVAVDTGQLEQLLNDYKKHHES